MGLQSMRQMRAASEFLGRAGLNTAQREKPPIVGCGAHAAGPGHGPDLPRPAAFAHAAVSAIIPVFAAIAAAALVIAPVNASAKGDPERGKVIAYTCTGCHGIPFYKNVYPTYTVPKLGGQNQEYLISALEAYRSGTRQHATMQAQAATLSDQDILDVTAYFVSFKEDES